MSERTFLVVDGYAPEGRAGLRKAGATEAGLLYEQLLKTIEPGCAVDRIYPADPPGSEGALARKLAAELGRAGIKNKVVSTPSPDGGPERAAVWGRLNGRNTEGDRPALVLLSHLDTVPANPQEWSVRNSSES